MIYCFLGPITAQIMLERRSQNIQINDGKSPGIKGQIMTFKVLETHDEGPVLKGMSVMLFRPSHALMHEYLRFSLLFLVGFVFLGSFFFFLLKLELQGQTEIVKPTEDEL